MKKEHRDMEKKKKPVVIHLLKEVEEAEEDQ